MLILVFFGLAAAILLYRYYSWKNSQLFKRDSYPIIIPPAKESAHEYYTASNRYIPTPTPYNYGPAHEYIRSKSIIEIPAVVPVVVNRRVDYIRREQESVPPTPIPRVVSRYDSSDYSSDDSSSDDSSDSSSSSSSSSGFGGGSSFGVGSSYDDSSSSSGSSSYDSSSSSSDSSSSYSD